MKVKVSKNSVSSPEDSPEKVQTQKSKPPISKFSTYISRVKKQVHPNLGISKSSMEILESFIIDFFERLCKESSQLMTICGSKTLKSKDIAAAIKLILPGELGKHARLESDKAVKNYLSSN